MTSQGTLSDFGSAFSASGFNNGRQRYGNTMTHFSDDGRLITNPDDVSYPHQQPQQRRLPDVPDYRSYDAGRERRRYERRRDDTWKDREIAREREREYQPREFYSPPRGNDRGNDRRNDHGNDHGNDRRNDRGNHASHYPSRHYGGGAGGAPVYGRTLPLPMSRDPGPPVRRFDDYRTRELRPNYETSHYDRNITNKRNNPGTYDWRIPVPGNNYDKTGLVASRNYGGKYGVLAKTTKAKFSQRPVAWYFIFAGLILLLAGLVNLTICVPNYHYCFIWLSVLTLILGGVGIYHGGRFKDACRNIYYVGHGIVVTLAAMVSSGLVFYQYFPLVKEIAAEKNQTALYVKYSLRTQPLVTTVPTSTRVWVCLAFDSAGMVFVVADYIALYAVILVAHRYWNYKMHLGKLVVPFCRPMLFNPFMELIWGELLVLVGLVSVFGCYGTEWHTYYTAVAAGAFVIITGTISSVAAKVPNRSWMAGLAIFFNFIGIVVCVVTIALNCLGIYDNIKALQDGKTNRDYLVSSALIFAFVLAAALICFFYCLGLLVRFSYYLTRSGYDRDAFTTSSRSDQTVSTVPHRYGYDKERGFDATSDPPLPYRAPRQGFFGRRY